MKTELKPHMILVLFHTTSEGEPTIEGISAEALKYLEIRAIKDKTDYISIYIPGVGQQSFKISNKKPLAIGNRILWSTVMMLKRHQRERKANKSAEIAELKEGIREACRNLRIFLQSNKRKKAWTEKLEKLKAKYLEHVKPEKRKLKEQKIRHKSSLHIKKNQSIVQKNDTPKEKERFEWKQRLAVLKSARNAVRPTYIARQGHRLFEAFYKVSKSVLQKNLAKKISSSLGPFKWLLPNWLKNPPELNDEL